MSKKHDATVDQEAEARDDYKPDRTAAKSDGRGASPVQKKKRDMTKGTFLGEMLSGSIYKRQQGRIARQVTFGAMFAAIGIGCWRLSQFLVTKGTLWQFGIPLVLLAVGVWFAFRLVNYPPFADFLIAVEAEMAKVSWPTRTELFRSSLVVMITIFGLAALLALYDFVLHTLLGELWKLGR